MSIVILSVVLILIRVLPLSSFFEHFFVDIYQLLAHLVHLILEVLALQYVINNFLDGWFSPFSLLRIHVLLFLARFNGLSDLNGEDYLHICRFKWRNCRTESIRLFRLSLLLLFLHFRRHLKRSYLPQLFLTLGTHGHFKLPHFLWLRFKWIGSGNEDIITFLVPLNLLLAIYDLHLN